jgi:hypothetical protein
MAESLLFAIGGGSMTKINKKRISEQVRGEDRRGGRCNNRCVYTHLL